MSRRVARELVLHMVFAHDYNSATPQELLRALGDEQRFAALAEESPVYKKMPPEEQRDYITRATTGVIEHIPELDAYIEKYSVAWSVGRITRISKAILRLCMYELLYLGIPVGASVNEALELAKKYDSTESAGFINGILGAFVSKELNK